ncbi:MAG: hypothetical protein K8S24_02225 [Candidatus Aegiribacteria sp.]|nr:hypothetical protein [Candidatus Aegiribacteria sp.]
MIPPLIDSTFADLALDFLEAGDCRLLQRIAETDAAQHLAAHSRRVSLSGYVKDPFGLVEQILTSPSMAKINPEELRARLSSIESDRTSQLRCWTEAAALLPDGALSGTVLYLTVGYDIGVALAGQASINLVHPHFLGNSLEEVWFYIVHEIHHAGFQKYNPLPALLDTRSISDLAYLIKYLTHMEGLAVHAARRWRTVRGALEWDSDYEALLDTERMDTYEREFFSSYNGLMGEGERPIEKEDWEILGRMSIGDRLWYRVGASMANRIEKTLGREVLIATVEEGPDAFFERYMKLE